ncbi:MAG: hypothetical protein L0220_01405 [Acidobacteria bacterium]|nr:hypothetical protein [Acidobacteriota bacterium]
MSKAEEAKHDYFWDRIGETFWAAYQEDLLKEGLIFQATLWAQLRPVEQHSVTIALIAAIDAYNKAGAGVKE